MHGFWNLERREARVPSRVIVVTPNVSVEDCSSFFRKASDLAHKMKTCP